MLAALALDRADRGGGQASAQRRRARDRRSGDAGQRRQRLDGLHRCAALASGGGGACGPGVHPERPGVSPRGVTPVQPTAGRAADAEHRPCPDDQRAHPAARRRHRDRGRRSSAVGVLSGLRSPGVAKRPPARDRAALRRRSTSGVDPLVAAAPGGRPHIPIYTVALGTATARSPFGRATRRHADPRCRPTRSSSRRSRGLRRAGLHRPERRRPQRGVRTARRPARHTRSSQAADTAASPAAGCCCCSAAACRCAGSADFSDHSKENETDDGHSPDCTTTPGAARGGARAPCRRHCTRSSA